MDVADAAWLAGFVDGEGHVSVHYHSPRKGSDVPYYQPSIGIRNTHLPSVDHVCALLTAEGIRHGVTVEDRPAPHKRSYWIYMQTQRAVADLAKILLPFSVTKTEQLRLAARWCESRLAGTRRRGYTTEEIAIADVFRTINARGAPVNTQDPLDAAA